MALEVAPKTSWCWLCRRAINLGVDEWRVVLGSNLEDVLVCGRCIERADVGPDVPLTYEEQEGLDDGE